MITWSDAGVYTGTNAAPNASKKGRTSRRDQVYLEIRHRIMKGEFGPTTRLYEERIAEEMGHSRTPVREALLRLWTNGLLEKRDGGYYPVLPNLAELRDLYELRITIEIRGFTRIIDSGDVRRHDGQILEELREHWRGVQLAPPEPDPSFVEVDESFHHQLLASSGNPVLVTALDSVCERIRPIRMYDFLTEDRVQDTIVEHLEIVDLTLAGKLPDALMALRRHIGESLEVVEQRAARAYTQMTLHRGRYVALGRKP